MALYKANGETIVDNGMNLNSQMFSKKNVSVNANSVVSVEIPFTIPNGYKVYDIVDYWVDASGTSGATGSSYCVVTNRWGMSSPTHVSIRNFSSSAAKVTVNCRVQFVKAP